MNVWLDEVKAGRVILTTDGSKYYICKLNSVQAELHNVAEPVPKTLLYADKDHIYNGYLWKFNKEGSEIVSIT